MQLFTLQSKGEQLAEAIKSRIVSGKVSAGAKLSSVRDLASKFKVSTKIVVGALDLLEDEQLIKREAGRGVFVRPYSANTNIEVCLLSWNVNFASDPYFNDLVHMSYPPYLQDGFNFTVRTVPFSREATTSHFAQELQKFDKMCHADCLILNAPSLNVAKIKACLKSKTPILFIGDFSHGPDPDIAFNQVTGDNAIFGENCIKKLVEQKQVKEFVLYIPSFEHYFSCRFCDGASKGAKALNVKMHLIETPKGFSELDIEQQNKIFSQITKKSGIANLRDLPAISGGTPNNFLKKQMNLGITCKEIYYPDNSKKYIQKFYNSIFSEIKLIANTPSKTRKIILKADYDDFILKQL